MRWNYTICFLCGLPYGGQIKVRAVAVVINNKDLGGWWMEAKILGFKVFYWALILIWTPTFQSVSCSRMVGHLHLWLGYTHTWSPVLMGSYTWCSSCGAVEGFNFWIHQVKGQALRVTLCPSAAGMQEAHWCCGIFHLLIIHCFSV